MPASDLPLQAEFSPWLRSYLFWKGVIGFVVSIGGILLLPFWILGLGQAYSRQYVDYLECELTERHLRFQKGILFQIEHTIPLDNIQDLSFKEGPLLRYFELSILKIETASQSGQGGSDMALYGIQGGDEFRSRVLAQRDRLTERSSGRSAPEDSVATGRSDRVEELLIEIRDAIRELDA